MIAQLRGEVIRHGINDLILDVGGVGYRVYTTASIISSTTPGAPTTLATHLVVRENALELFGFPTEREVRFFEHLISVSGIGPRSALGIMNLAPVEVLTGAIARGDTSYLTKVSGIGAKNAQKIVVELRDKLGAEPTSDPGHASDSDVIEALTALGYSLSDARDALALVSPEHTETNARLKAALKRLGTNH